MPYKLSKEAEAMINSKGHWVDPCLAYHASSMLLHDKTVRGNQGLPLINAESVQRACGWIQNEGAAELHAVLSADRTPNYPPMDVDFDPEVQDRIDDVVHAAHGALRSRAKKVLEGELQSAAPGGGEVVSLPMPGADSERVLDRHVAEAIQKMMDDDFAGLREFCQEIFAPVREADFGKESASA